MFPLLKCFYIVIIIACMLFLFYFFNLIYEVFTVYFRIPGSGLDGRGSVEYKEGNDKQTMKAMRYDK